MYVPSRNVIAGLVHNDCIVKSSEKKIKGCVFDINNKLSLVYYSACYFRIKPPDLNLVLRLLHWSFPIPIILEDLYLGVLQK